jgi:hypothetical protein
MPNARLTRSRRSAIFLAFDSSLHAVWPKRGFRELIFQFFSSQKPAYPQGRLSKVPYIAGYVYFRLQVSRAQLGRAGWLFGACVSDLERSPTSWCRSRLAVGSSRRRPAFCRPRGRRRTPRPASRQPEGRWVDRARGWVRHSPAVRLHRHESAYQCQAERSVTSARNVPARALSHSTRVVSARMELLLELGHASFETREIGDGDEVGHYGSQRRQPD